MPRINMILIVVIALIAVGAGLVFLQKRGARKAAPATPTLIQKPSAEVLERERKKTEEILKTDPTDPVHISNLKHVQDALENYYRNLKQYPKNLEDLVPMYVKILPKQDSNKNFFYAYPPAEKPQKYHLGVLLGGRNPADIEAFKSDTDLNSVKADYVNGFNGLDPVYDLKGGAK